MAAGIMLIGLGAPARAGFAAHAVPRRAADERKLRLPLPQRADRRRRYRARHAAEFRRISRVEAARTQNLKSVMLINSPGGNVVASDGVWRAAAPVGHGRDRGQLRLGRNAGGADGGRMRFGLRLRADGRGAARAPQQSHVALHRMSVSESEPPGRGKPATVSRRLADGSARRRRRQLCAPDGRQPGGRASGRTGRSRPYPVV